jgi:Uri superfamily endonuclease
MRISQTLKVIVGSLGLLSFESGIWIYVGSAMGEGSTSLENRLQRHFSDEKKMFWHIDRVIVAGANPLAAIWMKSNQKIECQLADVLIKSPLFERGPKGFGSSDCQSNCGTHLFRYTGNMPAIELLNDIFTENGYNPQIRRE